MLQLDFVDKCYKANISVASERSVMEVPNMYQNRENETLTTSNVNSIMS